MRTSRVLVATLILLVGTTLVVTIVALFQPGSATHEAMPLWWFPTFTSAGLLVSVVPGVAMALALLTSKRDWAHANEYRVVLPTVAVGSLFGSLPRCLTGTSGCWAPRCCLRLGLFGSYADCHATIAAQFGLRCVAARTHSGAAATRTLSSTR